MSMTVTPFLMFEGRAEEAMAFYVATFVHLGGNVVKGTF